MFNTRLANKHGVLYLCSIYVGNLITLFNLKKISVILLLVYDDNKNIIYQHLYHSTYCNNT